MRWSIAGDTGPLHLACALGRPVVGIYGPTDPSRNGPFGTRFKVLRSPESRRDHTRHGAPEAGLLTIQPEEVLRAADELLAEEKALMSSHNIRSKDPSYGAGLDHPLAARCPPHPCAAGLSYGRSLLYEIWRRAPLLAAVAWSLVLVLPGLWLRAYAAGYVKKNRELTVTGPYAHTRNPLYLGSMLIAFGFALAVLSWPVALVLAIGFCVIYVPVIASEERFLRATFPAFDAYCRRVPRLIPRLIPHRHRLTMAPKTTQAAFPCPLLASTASTMLL